MATESELYSQIMQLSPDEFERLVDRLDDQERLALLDLMASRGGEAKPSSSGSGAAPQSARDEACRYLDRDGLKYTITSQGNISLTFTKDHANKITVYVAVHDGYDIHMRTSDLVEFAPRQHNEALQIMSDLNNEYRYAKFCMDDDNTIHAEADLPGRSDGGDALDMLAQFIRRIEKIARNGMEDKLARLG